MKNIKAPPFVKTAEPSNYGCRSAYSWTTSGMQGQSFWGFRS